MLINTKHIVMFDDAVTDFGRIAHMVDDDGAVLVIKDGRPAYAVVPFDEVQEAEKPPTGSTPKVEEPTCDGGKPQSECCGGKGECGGHGHGASHGGHGHGAGHGHGGAGHGHGGSHGQGGHTHSRTAPWESGSPRSAEGGFFGHGSDAGHIHHGDEGDDQWGFDFHAGPGFDPLFNGGPNFSIDEFIGQIPPDMVEAGKRFVSQLSPLIGLFGNGGTTSTKPTTPPDNN
jgi:hypothetical protein